MMNKITAALLLVGLSSNAFSAVVPFGLLTIDGRCFEVPLMDKIPQALEVACTPGAETQAPFEAKVVAWSIHGSSVQYAIVAHKGDDVYRVILPLPKS